MPRCSVKRGFAEPVHGGFEDGQASMATSTIWCKSTPLAPAGRLDCHAARCDDDVAGKRRCSGQEPLSPNRAADRLRQEHAPSVCGLPLSRARAGCVFLPARDRSHRNRRAIHAPSGSPADCSGRHGSWLPRATTLPRPRGPWWPRSNPPRNSPSFRRSGQGLHVNDQRQNAARYPHRRAACGSDGNVPKVGSHGTISIARARRQTALKCQSMAR